MKRLGVFATAEEIETLKGVASAPYLVIGGQPPPDPAEEAHRIALAHGLPEIEGYYGCDLKTGEFVSA
jgi:hypothetical protein